MIFSSPTTSKIRDIVRISDVVSKKVKLKKKGKDFFGLCPFHHEKSPSFSVNDEKGFYHCFGCGANGDSIKFIQKTQNLSFSEAIQLLASEYNIKITSFVNPTEESKQRKFFEINKKASSWFHENLFSKANSHIIEYLNKRNIHIDCINDFSIGYAPSNGSLLLEHLLSLGYSFEEIIETGLAIDRNDKQICRFRNRIIFPIKNIKRDIIAFGGRVISENDMPKYLNSPETLLFKKKTSLYLEDIAFKNTKETDAVFVVEGYIDAISMHSIGLTNVVATLGTAVSDSHLMKLWRRVKTPIICMDGDRAGLAAVRKVISVALPLLKPGYSLKFVKLPTGYDPDDLIRTHGAEYFKNLIAKTTNLCEIICDIYLNKINTEIPENKALFKETLLEVSETITNLEIRKFYRKYFIEKLNHLFSRKYFTKKRSIFEPMLKNLSANLLIKPLSLLQRYEHTLAAILLCNPHLLQNDVLYETFYSITPKTKDLDRTYTAIIDCFAEVNSDSDEGFSIENFQLKIKKRITQASFDYLCGKSSYFIDTVSKQKSNEVSELWFDTFERYNLELMKGEYKLRVRNECDPSYKGSNELKKEIVSLDQKVKNNIMNRYD